MSARGPECTVVVPTFEQGPLLNLAVLDGLLDAGVERLLVDASHSPERVLRHRELAKRHGFTIVHTPGAPLAAQRNAAVRAAAGRVVVFVDDDVIPRPDAIDRLVRVVLDGRDVATARVVTPEARRDAFARVFHQDRGEHARDFTRRDLRVLPPVRFLVRPNGGDASVAPWALGSGTCFACRRDTARATPFREDLGVGTAARGGEDVDFFFRVLFAGGRARYEARAVVEHHHVRRSPDEYLRTAYGYGVGARAFYARNARAKPAYLLVPPLRTGQLIALTAAARARGEREVADMTWSTLRGWLSAPAPGGVDA